MVNKSQSLDFQEKPYTGISQTLLCLKPTWRYCKNTDFLDLALYTLILKCGLGTRNMHVLLILDVSDAGFPHSMPMVSAWILSCHSGHLEVNSFNFSRKKVTVEETESEEDSVNFGSWRHRKLVDFLLGKSNRRE